MSDKAIIVLGPTGTGKSLLALELALKLETGIVNVDSVQVYRDLVIGSAQPSKEDFKISPHYLYGYVPVGGSLTVASYCKDVEGVLAQKFLNKVAIFCGGSGFYIQALEKGMFDVPPLTQEQRKQLDQQIEDWGWRKTYEELLKKDASLGARIHTNDHYRTRRAWEMIVTTGKLPSEIYNQADQAVLKNRKVIKIGLDLDKEKLHQRIVSRVHKMIADGWVEEVEMLLVAGHRGWSALNSVGYSEVVEFIDGHCSHDEMVEKIVIANMQLIKKQRTWFKRDKDISWHAPEALPKVVEGLQLTCKM